jgi:hypothetical protein
MVEQEGLEYILYGGEAEGNEERGVKEEHREQWDKGEGKVEEGHSPN